MQKVRERSELSFWTHAFRFDDGVPLTAQAVGERKRGGRQKCGQRGFKVSWNADLRHHRPSSFIARIIILINPPLNCTSCTCFTRYHLLLLLFPHLLFLSVIIYPSLIFSPDIFISMFPSCSVSISSSFMLGSVRRDTSPYPSRL